MSGDSFGKLFRITTFGESHGDVVGVTIEGAPAGLGISLSKVQRELNRRRPGSGPAVSQREEPDILEVVSGIVNGRTDGGPIKLQVRNRDARSSDYDALVHKPRPGHADLAYYQKYGRIPSGGGRASGRETVGRVLAGAVAKQMLAREGITIHGRTLEVHGKRTGQERTILEAKAKQDSVGGVIQIVAEGVPPGLGEPVFDKLDADLAKALMSIGAVKGVEIGSGFGSALMMGSKHNDPIVIEKGRLRTRTNNAGGILGGISNGMPILCRIAVKPTSSIGLEQDTVDLKTMRPAKIKVTGRHDPCICPRMVPVAEAMVAMTLLDHLLRARISGNGKSHSKKIMNPGA
jgi:chorismate synthase